MFSFEELSDIHFTYKMQWMRRSCSDKCEKWWRILWASLV